jgi:hypothetical protein
VRSSSAVDSGATEVVLSSTVSLGRALSRRSEAGRLLLRVDEPKLAFHFGDPLPPSRSSIAVGLRGPNHVSFSRQRSFPKESFSR